MIKVVELNRNGKIELTKKQLEEWLEEAYWEGRRWYYSYPTYTTITSPDYTINSDYNTTTSPDKNNYTTITCNCSKA